MKQKILQVSVLSSSIGLGILFILLSTGACNINFMGNKIGLTPDNQTVQDSTLKNLVLVDKMDGEVIYQDTLTGKYFTNVYEKRKQNLPSSKVMLVFDEIIINDTIFYERDFQPTVLDEKIIFDDTEEPLKRDTITAELVTEYGPNGEIYKRNPKTGKMYYNHTAKELRAASSKAMIFFKQVIINDTIYYSRQ